MKTTQLDLLQRDWIEDVWPVVVQWVCERGEPWTSDDLHEVIPTPANRNWYGILLAKLRNVGLIEKVGWLESSRPSANGRVIRVWQRKLKIDDDVEKSNCCGANFYPPGWPDSDICTACGEHAEPQTDK